MLRHVALVRTDVSEECYSLISSLKRISELGRALAITNNRNNAVETYRHRIISIL
jgi:hypothetical protein